MEAEIAFRILGLFFWKLVHNALLIKEKLVKKQIISSACVLCGENEVIANRLFLSCSIARAVWFACECGVRLDLLQP